jgi:hypothetical protein
MIWLNFVLAQVQLLLLVVGRAPCRSLLFKNLPCTCDRAKEDVKVQNIHLLTVVILALFLLTSQFPMKLLITLCCCFTLSMLSAQVSTEKRIEFESDEDIYSQGVIGLGEDGLIVRSRDDNKEDGGYNWHYRKYDNNLTQVNEEELFIDKSLFLDESYQEENKLYSFFKGRKGDYMLSVLDASTFAITNHAGAIPKKTYTREMVVLGDYAYLSAQTRKASNLFALNVKTGRNKIIPIEFSGYKAKNITINNIQAIPESKELIVFAKLIDNRKSSDIFIIRLDETGTKVSESVLTQSIGQNVVSISANYLSPGRYTFVGTYSTKSNTASEGLFYCKTMDDKIEFFNTYNFLDLQDFLSYLKEKKQQKIERKKKRKEKAGKELKINYRIASHNTIETEDGYLLLGEAYYPTYRQESYTTYTTINGVSTPSTTYRSVFNGYQYTHAILCKFDRAGELVWDRSFKMYPAAKPFYVKRFISLAETEDAALKMVFASGNRIVTKAVDNDGNILLDFETDNIDTGSEADKVKRSWSNLEYWYDDYFYAFGYQKIKNKKDDDVKRKRKVYFINKVRF